MPELEDGILYTFLTPADLATLSQVNQNFFRSIKSFRTPHQIEKAALAYTLMENSFDATKRFFRGRKMPQR